MELLEYVMHWDKKHAREEWKGEDEKKIDLPEPLNVNILYQTAWVDADGQVNFRPDLYGQDELLDQFL
jgi:murein L,D-transpeptidase YcbB/YkuD